LAKVTKLITLYKPKTTVMKKFLLPVMAFVITLLFKQTAIAQDFDNAGQYLDYIGKQDVTIAQKFLKYNSAVSHGKRAKKVENLRLQLLNEVETAQENIASMPSCKGNIELRDSAVSFMKLYYNVLNDDYEKIVNMEDVAEQSYDNMEAYLLIQELVDKKLQAADNALQLVQKKFAADHNINLVASETDIDKMMEKVERVNKYYHVIYLIFFRSYKEEAYLLDAISTKSIAGIEQDKNALLQYAQTGLQTLDTTKSFDGDNSVVVSCKNLLRFYVNEVNVKMSTISDYLLKSDQFDKLKTTFNDNSTHTKDEVDNYNKAVSDINSLVNSYNATNNELNQQRGQLLNDWTNTVNVFFDQNMPKYK
jgi:hypothetical protein